MLKQGKPPSNWKDITTIESHAAGEPLRVIIGGMPKIPGKTILEERAYFLEKMDHFRKALMWEPRVHADMYGAIIPEVEGSAHITGKSQFSFDPQDPLGYGFFLR